MEQSQIIFRLYSELESNDDKPVYDVLLVQDGEAQSHTRVHLSDVDSNVIDRLKSSAEPITLLIPSEYTRFVNLGVISGSKRKALQAAPYLIEESLACPLDSEHIALDRNSSSKQTTAVVIQHQKLQQCLAEFAARTISIGRIHRDLDTWLKTGHSRIHIYGKRAIVETSVETSERCNALSVDNIKPYLAAIPGQLSTQQTDSIPVQVHTTKDSHRTSPPETSLPEALGDFQISYRSDHWFPLHFGVDDSCIDLAQGPYAAKAPWLGLRTSQWAFAACVYMPIIFLMYSYYSSGLHYQHSSEQLYSQQISLYKDLFPQDKKIVNLHAQFRSHLSQMESYSSGDQFLELFYTSIEQFGEITDHASDGLRRLQYNSSPSTVGLEVLVNSVKAFDSFEQILAGKGFTTSIESISQEGNAFLGRIQISAECDPC